MMEYQDFIREVGERLQRTLGEGYQVSVRQFRGINGIKKDAAVICAPGSITAECAAVSGYYELYREKEDMDIIVRELAENYLKAEPYGYVPDLNDIYDWNRAGENAVFRLVNTDANRELLKDLPHFEYLDLSQIFFLMIELNGACSRSILITNMLMKKWGISASELLCRAQKNTPLRLPEMLMDVHSFLSAETEAGENDSGKEGLRMYVLTNRMKLYGAGCILYDGLMKRTAEKFGAGCYVLPSSLHEVILIPEEKCSMEYARELKRLVTSINHDLVPEQDILSDSIYYYDKEDHFRRIL